MIYTALALACAVSCTAGKQGPQVEHTVDGPKRYRVSVSQGGRPVKNFSEELVHRIVIKPKVAAKLSAARSLPAGCARKELDGQGRPMGLRIVQPNAVLSMLGLRKGDLVTAAAGRIPLEPEQILRVFDQVQRREKSSISIERDGKPHEMLYFLEKPDNARAD